MKGLTEFITEQLVNEGGVFDQLPSTPEEAKQLSQKKYGNRMDDYIDHLFELWEKHFGRAIPLTPLRFNSDGECKVARPYAALGLRVLNLPGYKVTLGVNGTGKIKPSKGPGFTFGNGSPFKNRAAAGLDQEQVDVDQIKALILHHLGYEETGEGEKGEDNVDIFARFDQFASSKQFKTLIAGLAKEEMVDDRLLDKIVVKTGAGDTRRNKSGELWGPNFEVNSDLDAESDRPANKVIADITIDPQGKYCDPIYISCKLKASQLSGCTINFLRSDKLKELLKTQPYVEGTDKTFDNFFAFFGMDRERVWNHLGSILRGEKTETITGDCDEVDNKKVAVLMAKLLGGNYWYLKPTGMGWIGSEKTTAKNLTSLNLTHWVASDTGRTISIHGDFSGEKVKFVFRTDGKDEVPYRLFPIVDVMKLLQEI